MKRVILILLLSVAIQFVCLIGCGTDSPNQPNDPGQTEIPYRAEAEQAALYYSGEFRPPEDLTRTIGNELDLIRSTWSDSAPEVMTRFQPPWRTSKALAMVDDSTFYSVLNGINHRWDSLVTKLDATYWSIFGTGIPGFFQIQTEFQTHPNYIAEPFVDFPGVKLVGSIEIAQPFPEMWLRSTSPDMTTYYFVKYRPLNDLYVTFYRFVIEDGVAYSSGQFAEWTDTVDTDRPAWADTAQALRQELIQSPQFFWLRED